MKRFLFLALAAGIALAAAPAISRSAEQAMPSVGQKAPTFTLPSQSGQQISLRNYRGHWVVLYFYPRDMTSGCTIEAHNFQRDLAQYMAKKVAIVGISADTVDSHQQFCTKESLTFRLLADPSKQVISEYGSLAPNGAYATRNTFLVDPQGVIRKVYTKVNPNQHSQQVLADLAELEK